jgi:hypothetical protein
VSLDKNVRSSNEKFRNSNQINTSKLSTETQDTLHFSSEFQCSFSTFYGGNMNDYVEDMEIDSENNIIVVGYTQSTNLPIENAYQESFGGSLDAYIAKFDSTGNSLIFATYIGGSDFDGAAEIAVDSEDNLYVTGTTFSSNFPTVNAIYPNRNGIGDAFVTKFSPLGEVIYSTYLGGSSEDFSYGCDFDLNNNLIITGHTKSNDFPITPNAFDSTFGGAEDSFLLILSEDGETIEYSTYLGGSDIDMGSCSLLNKDNEIITIGVTASNDFNTTEDAFQKNLNGLEDIFVTAFNSSDYSLLYSTFFGGNGEEITFDVVEDSQGNVIVAGRTSSTDLPLGLNPTQNKYGGSEDGFITKLNHHDFSLNFSLYIGGSNYDTIPKISIDSQDNILIIGTTASEDFSISLNAYQSSLGGGEDAFISIVQSNSQSLLYSTFLGGENNDNGMSILSDNHGNILVVGNTLSSNFPITYAYQSEIYSGDTFISKFSFIDQTKKFSLQYFELFSLPILIPVIIFLSRKISKYQEKGKVLF